MVEGSLPKYSFQKFTKEVIYLYGQAILGEGPGWGSAEMPRVPGRQICSGMTEGVILEKILKGLRLTTDGGVCALEA